MIQQALDRLVASATGDDLREVRRLGFQLADPDQVDYDPEPLSIQPHAIDWDEVDRHRNIRSCN
ncbi:hypothetical protein DTL21_10855 [Bremerella cremea]|uniref:Uncharacterized protein n=1 Tax=Blastopirellula marina TaxID=124 RepID=A0A2S8FW44_9BACT|nr:hypothetical protein C5Y83_10850 [Blastopirellula marina]RCS49066.1 hypothetical protein DTL21_10855 [Bremerella cremea]